MTEFILGEKNMQISRWFKFIYFGVTSFFFLLYAPLSYAADIYSWQDENGSTVYSNQPNPNAKQIKLKPISFVETTSTKENHNLTQQDKAPAHDIKFLYPLPDQSIQHPGENLTFIVQNASALLAQNSEEKKQAVILLDGQIKHGIPIYQNMFNLTPPPPPGEHTIQLKILGKDQNILAETSKVTFYIHSSKRKTTAGTQTTTTSTYQATAGGNGGVQTNMSKFYADHKDSLIKPQTPYVVQGNWDAYNKQIKK